MHTHYMSNSYVIFTLPPLTAICNPPCQNGICDRPDHCVCTFGWKGKSCGKRNLITILLLCTCYHVSVQYAPHYTAACFPPCEHGNCTGPDTCKCLPGWTGEACDEGMLKVHVYRTSTIKSCCSDKWLIFNAMQLFVTHHAKMEGTV